MSDYDRNRQKYKPVAPRVAAIFDATSRLAVINKVSEWVGNI
jgi:hypothetical protein